MTERFRRQGRDPKSAKWEARVNCGGSVIENVNRVRHRVFRLHHKLTAIATVAARWQSVSQGNQMPDNGVGEHSRRVRCFSERIRSDGLYGGGQPSQTASDDCTGTNDAFGVANDCAGRTKSGICDVEVEWMHQ